MQRRYSRLFEEAELGFREQLWLAGEAAGLGIWGPRFLP